MKPSKGRTAPRSPREIQRPTLCQQVTAQHEVILEYVTVALQTEAFFSAPHPTKKIKNIQAFLSGRLAKHFEFEEQNVFLLLLVTGSTATKKVVRRLIREHRTMLAQVGSLQKKLSRMTAGSSDKAWSKLEAAFKDLLRMLLAHATTEDCLYASENTRLLCFHR